MAWDPVGRADLAQVRAIARDGRVAILGIDRADLADLAAVKMAGRVDLAETTAPEDRAVVIVRGALAVTTEVAIGRVGPEIDLEDRMTGPIVLATVPAGPMTARGDREIDLEDPTIARIGPIDPITVRGAITTGIGIRIGVVTVGAMLTTTGKTTGTTMAAGLAAIGVITIRIGDGVLASTIGDGLPGRPS